jgi:hypothetical protein
LVISEDEGRRTKDEEQRTISIMRVMARGSGDLKLKHVAIEEIDMNSLTSWWQKLQVRRVFTIVLAGVTFLIGTALISLGSVLPAQAATTPEATSYQVDHNSRQIPTGQAKADQASGGLVESLKETAENVREKLNLDEPLPQGTKLFIKQLQGEDVQVQEPKPGDKGGAPLNE